jgi:cell division protein FtsW (lipid II flippase)
VFAFFTFELRLFSKHLWVRRAITICFSVIDIITVLWVFNYARLKEKLWVYLAIILPVIVLFTVFVYYVADKIEKRNLAAINQKLASGNMDANKQ